MGEPFISTPLGVLSILFGVCAFYFFLERQTGWKLFSYLPPLIFIYLTPVILSNTGVIPGSCEVYDNIRVLVLPAMLVLLLLKVDVMAAIRIMGKGVFVMLFGTAGVVLGAPFAYWLVRHWLTGDAWKAFGTLAGSWIGGTGNMAAVAEMIDTGGTEFGLAVLGDTTIYMFWLPIMLASRNFAAQFARITRVSPERLERMEAASRALNREEPAAAAHHYLYLLAIACITSWLAGGVADRLPEIPPFVDSGTWRILLVTTAGIGLSFTRLREIPGSHALGMALVYLFVARMGASAELSGVADQALPFLLGATCWIFIHGGFCLVGAWLLRVDVHTAAIASAANIGGAASAPIVAAHHRKSLVPASILMALIGYAIGNYAAFLAAYLCGLVAGAS
jgi:uncharacterized membrane protein